MVEDLVQAEAWAWWRAPRWARPPGARDRRQWWPLWLEHGARRWRTPSHLSLSLTYSSYHISSSLTSLHMKSYVGRARCESWVATSWDLGDRVRCVKWGLRSGHSQEREMQFFLHFNPFESKILKITRPKLKFQELTLLVAPRFVA
jgi:hypothetical protein